MTDTRQTEDNEDLLPTSRFDDFAGEAFSAGTEGLNGCTAIVVASHKGVWTAHFWQRYFRGKSQSSRMFLLTFYCDRLFGAVKAL